MKKIISIIALTTAMAVTLAGCNRVVTGNESADAALKAMNEIVKANNDKKGFHMEMQHWGFSLPGEDKFEWSKDTSANEADFAMVMNAEPFISAGLDTGKLGSEWLVKEATDKEPAVIIHPFDISDKSETSQGSEDALRRLLKQMPDIVQYHSESQQYRLMLGEGFETRWTEKLGSIDGDIVFVIAADPLIEAGLDITKLQDSDWSFKEAGVDSSGKDENPNQLVKTYTLAK